MKQVTLILIALHFSGLMTAQTTIIQGNVTDEVTSLIWANIYIKNSTTGTTSDEKGNFTIEAKKGDTLAISYIGYQTKEIVIDTQKFIPVTLDNESLDEVVVTAQGIRRTSCGTTTYSTECSWSIETEEISENFLYSFSTPSLYPNPSSDGIFQLKTPNSYKEVQVYVTNMLGQQIQAHTYQNTQTAISLNLSSQRTGIYLINIIADGERLPTQKAIRG